jgi:tRNA pseudouridine55 synthase
MNEATSGLLLIDKPAGITSFDIIRALRRQTGVRKIGHAGTLDPLATGLMLMLFGEACKKASQLSGLDKAYEAEITLGFNSTTGDAEGELNKISDREPSLDEVQLNLSKFMGEIEQIPSQYSAIKIKGKAAYKYARKGQAVEIPSRKVTIHDLSLQSFEYPKLKVEARVSSGTYIRTLAEDVGRALETGAYLSALRRVKVGEYEIAESHKLSGVTKENLDSFLLTI